MPTRFRNRSDAGKRLTESLAEYKGDASAVVYALPRGGVVVGREIARTLGIPLDLVIARKVGHPLMPEYAICAVTEDGEPVYNELERADLDPEWLRHAIDEQRREALRRRRVYLGERMSVSVRGKKAIVTDDGVATGLTLGAALRALRAQKPSQLVVAVPVAPRGVVKLLRKVADRVFVLENAAHYLGAVGAYYDEFEQVSDEKVIELLAA